MNLLPADVGGLTADDAEFGMLEHLTPNQMMERIAEQAREIGRLKLEARLCPACGEANGALPAEQRAEAAESNLAHAEQSLASMQKVLDKILGVLGIAETNEDPEIYIATVLAELDETRAKIARTIEQCAKEAERFNLGTSRQFERAAAIAAAIRDLDKEPT